MIGRLRALLASPALADCRAELLATERARATLAGRLDHWMDQGIRAWAERDRAEGARAHAQACLVQAMADRAEAVDRICYLETEQRDLERSREELIGIADGLRAELQELRAGLAVGALRKGTR